MVAELQGDLYSTLRFLARGWRCSIAVYAHQVLSKIQFRPQFSLLLPPGCPASARQLVRNRLHSEFVYPVWLLRFPPQRAKHWPSLTERIFNSPLRRIESESLKENSSLLLVNSIFHTLTLCLQCSFGSPFVGLVSHIWAGMQMFQILFIRLCGISVTTGGTFDLL